MMDRAFCRIAAKALLRWIIAALRRRRESFALAKCARYYSVIACPVAETRWTVGRSVAVGLGDIGVQKGDPWIGPPFLCVAGRIVRVASGRPFGVRFMRWP